MPVPSEMPSPWKGRPTPIDRGTRHEIAAARHSRNRGPRDRVARPCGRLKIGVTPGAYADSVARRRRGGQVAGPRRRGGGVLGLDDAHVALAAGDIDVNYFQHKPFLDNAVAERGYEFADAGTGTLANIGLYSLKHKASTKSPRTGRSRSPTTRDQGRGLLLLEKAGLIKLKEGVGFKGTLDDIVENPKKLTFTEVEGPQLVRVTGDVDSRSAIRISSWRPRPSIPRAG